MQIDYIEYNSDYPRRELKNYPNGQIVIASNIANITDEKYNCEFVAGIFYPLYQKFGKIVFMTVSTFNAKNKDNIVYRVPVSNSEWNCNYHFSKWG